MEVVLMSITPIPTVALLGKGAQGAMGYKHTILRQQMKMLLELALDWEWDHQIHE